MEDDDDDEDDDDEDESEEFKAVALTWLLVDVESDTDARKSNEAF